MLKMIEHGTPNGHPTLLIAHGLFGSARNWGAIQRRLAEDRHTVAVDMRNHGESFRAPSHSYPDMAADLAEVITALDRPVDVLGHSMGGKAAMELALTHPDLVNRLIVADIAPVRYGHSQTHLIDAMRGLDLSDLSSRSEADRRMAGAVTDPGVRAFLLQSLDLRAVPPAWRLNLDVLEAEMDKITGWPGTEGRYEGPALFVTGSLSDYVTASAEPEIARLFPNWQRADIAGAGHWLHAEQPRAFEAELRTFLA